jgi:hypothetical protein
MTTTDVCFSLTQLLIGFFILYLFIRDNEIWFLLTLISVTVAVIYVCYRFNSHWRNVHRGLESSASRDASRGAADPPGRRHNGGDEDERCHDKSGANIPMTAEASRVSKDCDETHHHHHHWQQERSIHNSQLGNHHQRLLGE